MESKWNMEEFASQPYRVFTGVVLQRSREVGMTIYKHLEVNPTPGCSLGQVHCLLCQDQVRCFTFGSRFGDLD